MNGNPVAPEKYSSQAQVQMTEIVAAAETLLSEKKKGILKILPSTNSPPIHNRWFLKYFPWYDSEGKHAVSVYLNAIETLGPSQSGLPYRVPKAHAAHPRKASLCVLLPAGANFLRGI